MKTKLIPLISGCALALTAFADQIPTKDGVAGFIQARILALRRAQFPFF
jgi:hypothetical protein